MRALLLLLLIPFFDCSSYVRNNFKIQTEQPRVLKLEMFLNALGVESDGFPSINAKIDFDSDSSFCEVSYYEPSLKPKQYSFSQQQLEVLKTLITSGDFKKIKKEYIKEASDQPTSITTMYTTQDTLRIKDYGLIAELPMQELYSIVYDLKRNFR